jgi:hypothetical protein
VYPIRKRTTAAFCIDCLTELRRIRPWKMRAPCCAGAAHLGSQICLAELGHGLAGQRNDVVSVFRYNGGVNSTVGLHS